MAGQWLGVIVKFLVVGYAFFGLISTVEFSGRSCFPFIFSLSRASRFHTLSRMQILFIRIIGLWICDGLHPDQVPWVLVVRHDLATPNHSHCLLMKIAVSLCYPDIGGKLPLPAWLAFVACKKWSETDVVKSVYLEPDNVQTPNVPCVQGVCRSLYMRPIPEQKAHFNNEYLGAMRSLRVVSLRRSDGRVSSGCCVYQVAFLTYSCVLWNR